MLTDDTLRLNIDINGNKARKELSELSQTTRDLVDRNKDLRTELLKLEAAGQKNTEEYRKLKAELKGNNDAVKQNEAKMALLRKQMGLSAMTVKELRNELNLLRRQQSATIPGSKEWKEYDDRIKAVSGRLGELSGKAKQTTSVMGALKSALPALGFAAGAAAIGKLGSAVIDTRRQFEQYEAVLKNTRGSNQAAQADMKMLTELAGELPISLAEATESFIKMINRGMKPTKESITALTDVAMSQGKSLDQFVEAMLDAQTGEYERLKEFGIKAKKNGDEVSLTFKGQTTTIKATEEAMTSYLTGLGKLPGVAGAATSQMDTLNGAFSNAGDATDKLLNAMGEGGLSDVVKGIAKGYSEMAGSLADYISMSPADEMQKEMGTANNLAIQLANVNLSTEDRKKLIGELNAISPKLVENLNAESLNYDQLRKNVKRYNEEMMNKIILSMKDDELQKKNDEAAKKRLERLEKESNAIGFLSGTVKGYASYLKNGFSGTTAADLKTMEDALYNENLTLIERFDIIKKIATQPQVKYLGMEQGLVVARKQLAETDALLKEERNLIDEASSLGDKRNELAKKLGISTDTETPLTKTPEQLAAEEAEKKRLAKEKADKEAAAKTTTTVDKAAQGRQAILDAGDDDSAFEAEQAGMDAAAGGFVTKFEKEQEEANKKMALDKEVADFTEQMNADKTASALKFLEEQQAISEAEDSLSQSRMDTYMALSGALSAMFTDGSAASKAAFAFEKGLAIAQIWMNLPKEIAGIAANPFVLAMPPGAREAYVAKSIAMAKIRAVAGTVAVAATAIKGAKGKKTGGYTDIATTDDRVVDYVHSNEFVANAQAVRNPNVRQVLDIIDIAQRNNTIKSLDLSRVLSAGSRGYQQGGFTPSTPQPAPQQPTTNTDTTSAVLVRMASVLDRLEQNGVQGVWDYDYDKRTRAKMAKLESDVSTG